MMTRDITRTANTPVKKPTASFWGVTRMDIKTRQKFVGMAKTRGMSVSQAMKDACEDWVVKMRINIAKGL